MLKQSQTLKTLTKLSPQQIYVIKLLELPTIELEEKIEKELEENPALEEGQETNDSYVNDNNESTSIDEQKKNDNEFSFDDYISDDDDTPSYKLYANNFSKDDKQKEIPFSGEQSFYDYLLSQLHLISLNEKETEIAKFLIGTIDEDGYLRFETENLVDQIEFKFGLVSTEAEVNNVILKLKELDPPGVFAKDLQDCLLIQLNRKEKKTLAIRNAIEILEKYYVEFTKKTLRKNNQKS